jgi:hypothetical protein
MTAALAAPLLLRLRPLVVAATAAGALALALLGAEPARAQAATSSNLEGRLDKIRQGQRNARIAVEVLIAKHLLPECRQRRPMEEHQEP